MAATRYMVEASAPNRGSWTSTASWSATSGGVGGSTVPVSTDTVIIDRGSFDIINATGQAAVDLESLTVTAPGVTCTTGLTIAVSNTPGASFFFYAGGGGAFNFTAGTNGCDKLIVNRTRAAGSVGVGTLGGQFRLIGGTTIDLELGDQNPDVYVGPSAVLSGIIRGGAARLVMAYNAADVAEAYVDGGTVESARSVDIIEVGAGCVWTHLDPADVDTSVKVHSGGRFQHRSTGTIALAETRRGAAAVGDGGFAFTVTASREFDGGECFRDRTSAITFTAATDRIGGN